MFFFERKNWRFSVPLLVLLVLVGQFLFTGNAFAATSRTENHSISQQPLKSDVSAIQQEGCGTKHKHQHLWIGLFWKINLQPPQLCFVYAGEADLYNLGWDHVISSLNPGSDGELLDDAGNTFEFCSGVQVPDLTQYSDPDNSNGTWNDAAVAIRLFQGRSYYCSQQNASVQHYVAAA